MMKNISVIGAGTMGNGIAHVFAQYGFNTHTLIDVNGSHNWIKACSHYYQKF